MNSTYHRLRMYADSLRLWRVGRYRSILLQVFGLAVLVAAAAAEESCISCHGVMPGLERGHDPKIIGCAACHAGAPAKPSKSEAHLGMRPVPGNLNSASSSCSCHQDIVARVQGSLMTHAPGIVAVNRFVFGEAVTPDDATASISKLGHSAADGHAKQLCSSCHLGLEKKHPAPPDQEATEGGCAACHAQYSADRKPPRLSASASEDAHGLYAAHPSVGIRVGDEHCFACHSRSGRIALSYQGWHETGLSEAPRAGNVGEQFKTLTDGRVLSKQTEDVHHERGLSCIDCHGAAEVMGDGAKYAHKEEAVKVACADCHAEKISTKPWQSLDQETKTIARLLAGRELTERVFLAARRNDRAIPNAYLDRQGRPVLQSKISKEVLPLKAPAAVCSQIGSGHARLSCQSCHSAWAPQCITCHTSFESGPEHTNPYSSETLNGSWLEEHANFLADPPVLGVVKHGSGGEAIEPFVPGMILNVSGADPKPFFRRLYARLAPHTTRREARSCKSCHTSSLAIGAGRGEILNVYQGPAINFKFSPKFPLRQEDRLPADAWTGFLRSTEATQLSTREGARPFNPLEQERILVVGTCLDCHQPAAQNVQQIYADFRGSLKRRRPSCRGAK